MKHKLQCKAHQLWCDFRKVRNASSNGVWELAKVHWVSKNP